MVYATNKIQTRADINLQVCLHEHAGLLYDIKASLSLSMPYTLQPLANCRHYNIVFPFYFFEFIVRCGAASMLVLVKSF